MWVLKFKASIYLIFVERKTLYSAKEKKNHTLLCCVFVFNFEIFPIVNGRIKQLELLTKSSCVTLFNVILTMFAGLFKFKPPSHSSLFLLPKRQIYSNSLSKVVHCYKQPELKLSQHWRRFVISLFLLLLLLFLFAGGKWKWNDNGKRKISNRVFIVLIYTHLKAYKSNKIRILFLNV